MAATSKWSRQTLDRAPGEALLFLGAVRRRVAIRAALAERGYGPPDHQEGWRLLHAATGYVEGEPLPLVDPEVRAAIAFLDAWDNANLPTYRAALERLHPQQAAALFEGLQPQDGVGSVLVIERFLERVEAMAAAPEPAKKAAVATLEKRGLTGAARKDLGAKIRKAQELGPAPAPVAETDADRTAALEALKLWLDDWSTTARAVIKRRDHLIALGLANRRGATEQTATDSVEAAAEEK